MTIEDEKRSVIVIGAGVIGLACAHYLVKAGKKVTVLDKGALAGACSHANCGYICPSHVLPLTEPGAIRVAMRSLFQPNAPFRVKPKFSPALWKWMLEFARRCTHAQMLRAGIVLKSILDSSMAEYRQLMAEESLNCEWKDTGLLYVLKTAKGLQEFAKTDRFLAESFGVKALFIDGHSLPSFDPALKSGLAGAYFYEGDASVRPDRLNASWIELLKQRGVQFRERCELLSLEKTQQQVSSVNTSQGIFKADHYVFATGAWSSLLAKELGCPIPVQQGKGYSVTMESPVPSPVHPILFPEHKVGVSPFDSGYRLGSMMEFSGFDKTIPRRRIDQLKESAKPYLKVPFTSESQELGTWYGWRPMTWDSLPIIGPVPQLCNAYLATGHNMLGLSLAAATGKLIAELITKQPTHLSAAPFSVARFGR